MVFSIGFNAVTAHLKAAVAVRVAATETTAVVPAVTKISFSGTGILKSVNGMSTFLNPCSGSSFASACTPSGASKSLGGTTIGMYDGTSAVGKGIDIVSIFCIDGISIVGMSTYSQGVPTPCVGVFCRLICASIAFSISATDSAPSFALTQPITVSAVRSL